MQNLLQILKLKRSKKLIVLIFIIVCKANFQLIRSIKNVLNGTSLDIINIMYYVKQKCFFKY